MTKDEMHEREPLNIIMRYKAERTTEAEAAAEIRAYVTECMRRAAEPGAKHVLANGETEWTFHQQCPCARCAQVLTDIGRAQDAQNRTEES